MQNERWMSEMDRNQWQWFDQEFKAQWRWKAQEEQRSVGYVQQWAGRRAGEIEQERNRIPVQKAVEAQLHQGAPEPPPTPATLWMQAEPGHYCGDDWHSKQFVDPYHYKSDIFQ